jgi:predicted outer membrane repeat protein
MKPAKPAVFVCGLVVFALPLLLLLNPVSAQSNSTFTVTSNADIVDFLPGDGVCETASGNDVCTLRAAIMESNALIGEDIIDLPAATYLLTIPGAGEDQAATGDLDITDSLRLRGQYQYNTFIDAQGLGDRVLDISGNGVTVSVSRVHIAHGSVTGDGGAIRARADLLLQDSHLDDNQATGRGGAIFSTSSLFLYRNTISYSAAGSDGGAIYTSSDLSANETQFIRNTSEHGGGAIFASPNASVHIVDVTFNSNQSIIGGGTVFNKGTLVMEGGSIKEGDSGMDGGALVNDLDSAATLTDVSLTDNHASQDGGAIFVHNGSSLIGQNLYFDQNSSDGMGGAVYVLAGTTNLDRSVLSNNTAFRGGALATGGGISTIENSTFISNTATGDGGGIFNTGNLTLMRTTLNENHALNGGAIWNDSVLTVENSTISQNSSIDNGGGIYDEDTSHINNSTITANTASADILNPGGRGGGVYALAGSTIQLRNSIVAGNHHRQVVSWIDDDCNGVINSGDYNLVGALTGCTLTGSSANDLTGVDPQLDPLANNGGPTQTHALPESSPAIDAANPAGCLGKNGLPLSSDQRGIARPLDGNNDGTTRCDIGAYELSRFTFIYLPMTIR